MIDQVNKQSQVHTKAALPDHDARAQEFKADMDTLRYYLKRDKIYDTGTQDFNKEFLKTARKKYSGDFNIKRLFNRITSDDDFIYLMNNIAANKSNTSNLS